QRAKQVTAVEEQARKKGSRTSFKELNGYPVETIDNAAVNALRNSYQSALSHYLAGFIYESLGEGSLAAPGYRLANELQPNQPLLEEALRGLDQRLLAATRVEDDGMSDVLFIIGSGAAPAIHSRQFRAPVFIQGRMVFAALSVPVMSQAAFTPVPTQLDHADDRTWRTLPSEISIARARLPRGVHSVTLSTPDGQRNARIDVRGRYAVVDLRLLRHRIYVHAPNVSQAQGSKNTEGLK